MKICIMTLGCRTNQAEGISFERQSIQKGHVIVNLNESPDICIINTCTVTTKADYQSRQLINRALKANSKVIVTGCYAQLNSALKDRLTGVTFIDNHKKEMLTELLPDISEKTKCSISRARPIIKVQEGCNNDCSYCAIVKARGRARSVPKDVILREIDDYVSEGFKEIVLTGTNIGQYGVEYKEQNGFMLLLEDILEKTGISRIRIGSIEINYLTKDLIRLIGSEVRICRHLHIPLQSGDNRILRLMNRDYETSLFVERVNIIKGLIPDISIGSDIIVGFPHEGLLEFENTYELLKVLPLSYMHVFVFSRRKDTIAGTLGFISPQKDINKRSQLLRKLSQEKKTLFINSQIGKVHEIIVEKSFNNYVIGTTGNYIKTIVSTNHHIPEKSLINVRLKSIDNGMVYGDIDSPTEAHKL